MKRIIIMSASLLMATNALAGGYRVAIQGQKALGMGHTGVAVAESAEVLFFNPAGMTSLESDMEMVGGLTLLQGSTKYQNETTNAESETDNPLGTPLNFYLSKRHNDQLSYGIGVYTPYGNKVDWPTDWQGSHLVNSIELAALYIQPSVAYQINDSFGVGLGINYVTGSVEYNRNLSTSLADADGNRSNVTLKESGVDDWGYNLGFTAKINDALTMGISYRSQVDLKARGGKANFENVPTSLQAVYADTKFDADLVLPAEWTLGLAYRLSEDTLIAFDINRTNWDAYDSLDISFDSGAPDSINPRDYEDANIYRIGVQHRIDDTLMIRAGMYRDESPIPSGRVTPETARNDALAYTAGATYTMSQNLELDFSLLIVTFDEFEGSYEPQNFSGSYLSSAYSVGFGFNYKF